MNRDLYRTIFYALRTSIISILSVVLYETLTQQMDNWNRKHSTSFKPNAFEKMLLKFIIIFSLDVCVVYFLFYIEVFR